MPKQYYNDEEALRCMAQGDQEAFCWIYERYFFTVARVGTKYLQDVTLTKDLVQEIFSAIWIKRQHLTGVKHLEFYLYTMTRNLALLHLKKIAREAIHNVEYAQMKPTSENNIEPYLADKDFGELLDLALKELPTPHQTCFKLAKVQGLSHAAIAEQLEISPETVGNYISLALKSIRKRLSHHLVSILFWGISSFLFSLS